MSRVFALKLAPTLLGMNEDEATAAIFNAKCAYRFIVLSGERCGDNSDRDNDTLCLYSDVHGKIIRVVVGSMNVFEPPRTPTCA